MDRPRNQFNNNVALSESEFFTVCSRHVKILSKSLHFSSLLNQTLSPLHLYLVQIYLFLYNTLNIPEMCQCMPTVIAAPFHLPPISLSSLPPCRFSSDFLCRLLAFANHCALYYNYGLSAPPPPLVLVAIIACHCRKVKVFTFPFQIAKSQLLTFAPHCTANNRCNCFCCSHCFSLFHFYHPYSARFHCSVLSALLQRGCYSVYASIPRPLPLVVQE